MLFRRFLDIDMVSEPVVRRLAGSRASMHDGACAQGLRSARGTVSSPRIVE
jgi:hypothetical protein